MDFKKFVRPKLKGKFFSLETLADLVKSSPRDLLDAACEGKLQVFVRKPDGVRLFSVHADALDLEDENLFIDKVQRRALSPNAEESEPIEVPALDPGESQPLNMAAFPVDGLRLSRQDCYEIREKEVFRQFLFPSGVRATYSWQEEIQPTRGHFRYFQNRTLRDDGWKLACYELTQPIQFHEGIGYSRPKGVDLSLDGLFVTSDDVDRYVDTLDPKIQLADFIVDGRIAIEKLPSFVSQKLIYLFETNDIFFGDFDPANVKDVRERQESARKHLMKVEFQTLFDGTKEELSTGQLLFCKECITPASVRLPKPKWADEWPGHLTPELLLMLYAAIRTWGRPRVKLDDVSSHPLTSDVASLFRELGFTGDDPKSAPTIIRPEGASKGRPVPVVDPLKSVKESLRALKPKQA